MPCHHAVPSTVHCSSARGRVLTRRASTVFCGEIFAEGTRRTTLRSYIRAIPECKCCTAVARKSMLGRLRGFVRRLKDEKEAGKFKRGH